MSWYAHTRFTNWAGWFEFLINNREPKQQRGKGKRTHGIKHRWWAQLPNQSSASERHSYRHHVRDATPRDGAVRAEIFLIAAMGWTVSWRSVCDLSSLYYLLLLFYFCFHGAHTYLAYEAKWMTKRWRPVNQVDPSSYPISHTRAKLRVHVHD